MSVSTANPTRTAPPTPRTRWRTARRDLAQAYARAATMVSAARHHNWSPALTISALGLIDAAFYQIGLFAGLLTTGISILVFDWSRGDA